MARQLPLSPAFDARGMLGAVVHHLPLAIGLAVAFAGVAALLADESSPRYTAGAQIFVSPDPVVEALTDRPEPIDRLANDAFPRAHEFLEQNRRTEDGRAYVEVASPDTLAVVVEAKTAGRARSFANSFATAFLDAEHARSEDSAATVETVLKERLLAIDAEIAALPVTATNGERQSLLDRREQVGKQLEQVILLRQLDRVATAQMIPSSGATPITTGGLSRSRASTIAGALGLLVGIAAGILRHQLDTRIRRPSDLKNAIGDVPIIGTIPRGPATGSPAPLLSAGSDSPQADAYRALAARVQAARRETGITSLVVASPRSIDGATSAVAASLAVVLARRGLRVLALSADLRTPSLHTCLGLRNDRGLADVLAQEVPLRETVQEVPGEPGLSIVAAGSTPVAPSELLAGMEMSEILGQLAAEYDIVVIESSAILVGSDAISLAQQVDATFLVVEIGATDGRDARAAVDELRLVGAVPGGAVLLERPSRRGGHASMPTIPLRRSTDRRSPMLDEASGMAR